MRILKGILSILLLLVLVTGIAYAYVALTGTIDVTIEENLSFVGDSSFSFTAYPAESTTQTITIANASSNPMEVDITYSILPVTSELSVTMPNKITVPGVGEVDIDLVVSSSKSIAPSSYIVTYEIVR